jgi:6-phospho-3-hexuloisomerase
MTLSEEYSKLYDIVLREHREVFERQDQRMLSAFLESIKRHERIFVMGVGREGIAARGFAMRLMHLGKEVHWIWDDTTPGIGEKDLFIVVNGSGNIGHINYVIEQALPTKAEIVVVTGSPSGKAAKLAGSVLFVPASVYNGVDPVVESVQPMGNLFEQHLFMLFDIVIMLLEQQLKVTHQAMASRHRNVE